MKYMKRLTVLLVAAVFWLSLCCVPAMAEGEAEDETNVIPASIEFVNEPAAANEDKERNDCAETADDEFAGFETLDYSAIEVINSPLDEKGVVVHRQTRALADGYAPAKPDELQVEALRVLASTTNSYSDAVIDAREYMKNRVEDFEVVFVSDRELGEDALEIAQDFFDDVLAHTGDPKEGDYLKWQNGGYVFHPVAVKMNDRYYYTFECSVSYYDTAEQEAEVDAAVHTILKELGLLDGGFHTDYEKILKIYGYVTQTVHYGNTDSLVGYSAYSSIILHKSVCQGYTLAIYRLSLEAGLDARIIVSQPADHAWNIVRIGSSYYNLDATWDRNSDSDPWWVHFLCGDAGHSVGETVIPGDESFRDAHLAVDGDPNSYYRPAWVDAYHIPQDCYPCFAAYDEFSQLYPYGKYIKQVHVADNLMTTCVPDPSGCCVSCGQLIGHTHVFDRQISSEKFLAFPGDCRTFPSYYYSCVCGMKDTQTFSSTEYGSHTDTDHDGICEVCKTRLGPIETAPSRRIQVETGKNMVTYADGAAVPVDSSGYIELPDYETKVVTTFTYNSADTALNYPEQSSMKVYFISKDPDGNLVANREKSFDGIMQYMGASVRCDGSKGIRIITGIPVNALQKLKGSGLNGWKLAEYGTIVGNDTYLTGSVILGSPKTASAAFNDKPFAHNGSVDSYTVGLTFNDMEQCKVTFSMRPYMKLTNGSEDVTLYGGIVHRSIGYVAWQNRSAYDAKTQPTNYNYIQDIIRYCGLA